MSLTNADIRVSCLLSRLHGAGFGYKSVKTGGFEGCMIQVLENLLINCGYSDERYGFIIPNYIISPWVAIHADSIEIDRDDEETRCINLLLYKGEYPRYEGYPFGDSAFAEISFPLSEVAE